MSIKTTLLAGLFLSASLHGLSAAETAPDGAASPDASSRHYVNFDLGWRFRAEDNLRGMEPGLDDSAWRIVDVPHDWSIEGPFDPNLASCTGFAPGGIAWYRRHFRMETSPAGKIVTVEFDGVYDNCEVWLNGFLVGGRPYGFESFTCDLTRYLRSGGADNVLSVRVDHSRVADSRWYTGSGIYRHVRLCISNPLHLGHWGTAVTTPAVSADSASIHIETDVRNDANEPRSFGLASEIIDPDGKVAAISTAELTLAAGCERTVPQDVHLAQPVLWSTEHPGMYSLHSRLTGADGGDESSIGFGVRTLKFDPATGFSLNGVGMKLKGVCLHQDGGSVGVAIPAGIWERRLRTLKSLGVNAIRTSHNPPAPEFLDLCDQMGFLVMDEAFDEYTPAKNKWVDGWNVGMPSHYGYSEHFAEWSVRDLEDIVRRDRNHPCIIMWSIGNEIDGANDPFSDPVLGEDYRPGNPPASDMVKWGKPLVAAVKRLDRTRPVTAALANVAVSNACGYADILDAVGYNYQEHLYAADRRRYPERFIYGSENSHAFDAWIAVRDNPAICGQFLWAGVDYLGEAAPWPARANPDGLLDLCGFVKPLGRFRQSLWTEKPMVYLCAEEADATERVAGDTKQPVGSETWNWRDGATLTVLCYTNCPDVTLYLNGGAIGTKSSAEARDGVLRWTLPFQKGVLKAVGQRDGGEECAFQLQTAEAPYRIALHSETMRLRATAQDVAQMEFEIVDQRGVRVPDAGMEVTFEVAGPGVILGAGNGDVTNGEPVRGPTHRAYQGRGLLVIRSTEETGTITVKASAAGLLPASTTVASN